LLLDGQKRDGLTSLRSHVSLRRRSGHGDYAIPGDHENLAKRLFGWTCREPGHAHGGVFSLEDAACRPPVHAHSSASRLTALRRTLGRQFVQKADRKSVV